MGNQEVENARKVLKENGYFVENLWSINDVKFRYNCNDDQAQKVLDKALTNEATMEQIWFAIHDIAYDEGFELID
jgi:hypothetical protein